MNYPKNFDPYMNKYSLSLALNVSEVTALKIIQKANDNLIKNGYKTFKGNAPVSEILKIVKSNKETLIYFWEFEQRKSHLNEQVATTNNKSN